MLAALSELDVVRPKTLDAAFRLLQDEPGLRPLAGATDLLVVANAGGPLPQRLLDLSALSPWLRHVSWAGDGSCEIGALATYADVLADPLLCSRFPSLASAARQTGALQIQARGTLAGNVENGSPAADSVPVLMAHRARVRLAGPRGERELALDAYYTGYRRTRRAPDEIITALVLPPEPIAVTGHAFRKVGTRALQAITKVGLAAVIGWQGGAISEARIVAVSMGPTTCRCPAVEAALAGTEAGASTWPALREAQDRDTSPIDDVRSTAAYRREVFHRILRASILRTRGA